MTGNARLDDFGEDGNGEDSVEPIRPVLTWRPDHRPCPRCGDSITEGWEDGGISAVCTTCKEW